MDLEVIAGEPAEFHRRDLPDPLQPVAWWFHVERPAIVLGSAQPMTHIDEAACRTAGIDIVRRRSGGGAVLLEPGDVAWVDVLIPRADDRWTDDVSSSAFWLGDVWQRALDALGVAGTTVHRGPMIRSQWSGHVCFAGVGGGEVVRAGAKVVGISQRRTRDGARFQCAVYRHWRPAAHVPLFAPPGPTADDLAGLAFEVDAPADVLRAAFAAAIA